MSCRPSLTRYSYSAPSRERYLGILREEAEKAGVEFKHVVGRAMNRELCQVRFRTWRRLWESNPNYSLPGIARAAGGYDHTTILNGLRRINEIDPPKKVPISISGDSGYVRA